MPTPSEKMSSQDIMFLNDNLLDGDKVEAIKLCHPRTGTSSFYLIKDNSKLYELNCYDEGHRSWLIGSEIQSDGRLYVTNVYDITFIILPYLMKATANIPLEHLLMDQQLPAINRLVDIAVKKNFSHIADSKGNPELGVWKYNEEKTLSWLAQKVTKLATRLKEMKVPTSTAQSFTFVRTMTLDENKEAYMVLAHGILSDNITEELSKRLYVHLKLPEIREKRAKNGIENEGPNKKRKSTGPTEDYSKDNANVNKTNVPQSAKAKALAKSAQGTKSITSFFNRK